jgi:gas vesicle protein
MSIGSLVSRIIPTAVGFVTGGPVGAASAAIATESAKRQEKQIKRQVAQENEKIQQLNRSYSNMIGLDAFGGAGRPINTTPVAQPSFFNRLGNIASNVGDTLLSGLESAVPSVLNRAIFGERPVNVGQQPALTTITNVGAQESQASGSIQAGAGALVPSLLSGARSLLKSPAGQLALGTGAGAAVSFLSPSGKQMRITRKMKSQARMVLNLAGGNISIAADILNISEDMLITILLKRFRNDGPVVTKAALRKTKQTVRRLHNMQDLLKSITPTAAGRRRTPTKRAMTTTLIKN